MKSSGTAAGNVPEWQHGSKQEPLLTSLIWRWSGRLGQYPWSKFSVLHQPVSCFVYNADSRSSQGSHPSFNID